jgi:predicted type IV restriction endonuclease
MAETIAKAVADIVDNHIDALRARDEEAVKQTIVLRLLALADWKIFNSQEVTPEYSVGSKKVDYALQIDNEIQVFVEVKKLIEPLETNQKQLMDYCEENPVNLAVLTNGRHWWLYLPSWKGSWEEKRFCTLDLVDDAQSHVQKRLKDFLLRDRVIDGKAVRFARAECNKQLNAYTAKKAILEAWNRIIQSPHDGLINLIMQEATDIIKKAPEEHLVREFLDEHENAFAVPDDPTAAEQPSVDNVVDPNRKKPYSIRFLDSDRSVTSWPSTLSELCFLINEKQPEKFEEMILTLRGRDRPYFSKAAGELRQPKPLNINGLYMEGNLGPTMTFSVCEKLLTLFEYKEPRSLEIQVSSTQTGEHFTMFLPHKLNG